MEVGFDLVLSVGGGVCGGDFGCCGERKSERERERREMCAFLYGKY